ncbi:hypothetical protein [Actinomadura madurae]|uniref:hypothetical protein n=1 Tax=Actinomadura madurae TaxID=1993 RepID=UPI0020D2102D|nr:hypothetical protein [Actinomadura madurae]MCP9947746.1 hypothetical protein [Actinomadura madurae]MCP9964510.1 hypothetical protein [Actinomadura madurae]MCP9976990.1 hypothetical protein [Actinomadura madurae]MCQ0011508.1 hypothetical protein [Actinomadura madurae]MCQ0013183.1 hypothetical protein [Actinomadura madurae]
MVSTACSASRVRWKAPTMSMPPSLITTWLRGDAADTTAGNNTGAIIAAMPTTRPRSSRAGARSP